ncbi:hypothetical protein IWX65_002855 [Arthrobacter sp. CAN_A214]|uniref:hypothetical protein n=1 Tax=Arthrobacter sp. CAN_A214 TaxID=2787720 RepID=UPI0018CA3793
MDWFKGVVEGVAGSAIEKLIQFLAGWLIQVLTEMINFVGTWWLKIGAPSMAEGSATERVGQSTLIFVGMAGVIGTAFALIKLARDQDRASTENLLMGMMRTVLTTALAVPVVGLLFGVTDVLAPWLVRTISGSAQEDGLGQAMGLEALAGTGMSLQLAGLILFVAPLALLGAIINAVIVIFSYGAAIALCGILPIFAAASQTERGRKSFDKAVGWLAAVVLFKPAAAILYGAGLALMKGINGTAENEIGNTMIGLLTGLVIISSACVAMPALARVLVPAVSAGPQGMGTSGLAMIGGAVALGAVTAGVGAAGVGAAAAGGGGGAAAAGGGGAATTGTAGATEATGTAGTAAVDGSGSTPSLTNGTGGSSEASGASSGGGSAGGSGFVGTGHGGSPAGTGESGSAGGSSSGSIGSDSAGSSAGSGSTGGGAGGPTGAEQRPERIDASPENSAETGTLSGAGSGGSSGGSGGGPTGAERQAERTGAPTEAAAGSGGDTSAAGAPSGAEPAAPSDRAPAEALGAEPSNSPTAEGYRDGAPSGADKSSDKAALNRQRMEYALREAARDMEHGMESGDDQ